MARCRAGTCSSRTSPGWARRCWPAPWPRRSGRSCRAVQGHPDLLPSDVTGVSVFAPDTGTWEFRPGPVFAHVVLVDELNRTPPRTQAALLETMEEQQVSVDGESWPLPRPHLVIATQNPFSQLGTYPLVESQLDRFALATAIGYPDADTEARLVQHGGGKFALGDLRPVCSTQQWLGAQRATESVEWHRASPSTRWRCAAPAAVLPACASAPARAPPSGSSASAQAHAVLSARTFVTPDDVKAVAVGCLAHRLLTDEGVEQGVAVVRALLDTTPAPRP